MPNGLSFAHSNGSVPLTGHRFAERTRANPTGLTLVASDIYPKNRGERTRQAYQACFEQLSDKKRPFFDEMGVSHSNWASPEADSRISHSDASSLPAGYARLQSHPNPLRLTQIHSATYPQNRALQTHCAYLSCFQHLNPEKRPFFGERVVVSYSPKPAKPLQLIPMHSVAYARSSQRQTHCGYLLLFQSAKPQKWPFFRKRIAVDRVRRLQRSFPVVSHRQWVSSPVSQPSYGLGSGTGRGELTLWDTKQITRLLHRQIDRVDDE